MTQINREARKAALKRVLARTDSIITPKIPIELPESDTSDLLERVEQGYMESKIGSLLEDARKTRDIGKRELAPVALAQHTDESVRLRKPRTSS
jgi:hypothetical protein